jgi:hypothetical protein
MNRPAPLLASLLLLLGLLAGCSGGDEGKPDAEPTSSAPVVTGEPATPAPQPRNGRCYALSYDDALAPTTQRDPVGCRRKHTSQTFFVGPLDTMVDGHLLAVDSRRVRAQLARECPRRFAAYVGGSSEERRLSMLATAWFSPTLDQSDEGQAWLRCDVIALARPGALAPLTGSLAKVLDSSAGRARWGRCATGKPGTKGSEHVVCSRNDAWRAVATFGVPAGRRGAWPGEAAARRAGAPCEDRARDLADDPLSVTWGVEPPTKKQWAAGQRHGFCWAPRSSG